MGCGSANTCPLEWTLGPARSTGGKGRTMFDAPTLTTAYFVAEWIVRLTMLFWVPTRRSPEAAKGWLLLIFFQPLIGLVLYWLIGRPYLPTWRRQRVQQLMPALQVVADRLRSH